MIFGTTDRWKIASVQSDDRKRFPILFVTLVDAYR